MKYLKKFNESISIADETTTALYNSILNDINNLSVVYNDLRESDVMYKTYTILKPIDTYSFDVILRIQEETGEKKLFNKNSLINLKKDDLMGWHRTRIDFLKKNAVNNIIKILNQIKKDFNIKDIEYLKVSNYGIVFIVDSDKILKISSTSDINGYESYSICKNLLNNPVDGMIDIYNIWRIKLEDSNGGLKNGPIYAVLMKKCDILSRDETNLFNKFHDILNLGYRWQIQNHKHMSEKEMSEKLNKFDKKYVDEYINLYNKLKDKNIPLDDLRGDNLGRINGELVHFDAMDRTNLY
jgi:hypothetical protein